MNALDFRRPPVVPTDLVIDCSRLRLLPLTSDCSADIYRHFTSEITRYMIPAPAR